MCCKAPQVVRTEYGKYLATSSRFDTLKIGVLADTEESARELFSRRHAAWMADLETKD